MVYNVYPAVDDVTKLFPPSVMTALGKSTELKNTVIPMSQADRSNLVGTDLWNGRLIFNTTTNKINRYESGIPGWFEIDKDVRTDPLTLPGDPTLALHAAPKQYVDTKLSKAGGTMTGSIIPAPTAAVEPTATSWNSLTTNGRYINLMHGQTNPNGPGYSCYYHVENFCYSIASGNLTQVGYPYTADSGPIVYRSYYTGIGWSDWHSAGDLKANITFAANWSDYPGGYSPCRVTRSGGIVVMEGLAQYNTTTAWGAGVHYTLGYVPAGFRPGIRILSSNRYSLGGDSTRLDIQTDGTITVCPPIAVTPTTGSWVGLVASWRAA